ncbi:hypothetical protein DFS34DRAFT_640604 [Phlyctochytrium arcticum]|nr:hypothetical protein DFS34DRAFT_640604 [Phlyctochytrium arcticum]
MSVLPPPIPQPPYSAAPSPIVMMSTTDSEHQTSLPSTPFPYKNRSSTKSTTHRRSRSAQQYQRHQSLPLVVLDLVVTSTILEIVVSRVNPDTGVRVVISSSNKFMAVTAATHLSPEDHPCNNHNHVRCRECLYPINSYMPSLQQQMMWYQSASTTTTVPDNNNDNRLVKRRCNKISDGGRHYMTAAQQSMTRSGRKQTTRRHGSHGRPRRRMSGALAQFHQRQSSSSRRRRTEFNGDRPVMSYSSSQHPPSRLSHVTHASSRSDSSPSGDNHHPITTTQSPENNNSSPEHAPDCCLDNPTTSTDSLLHPSQHPTQTSPKTNTPKTRTSKTEGTHLNTSFIGQEFPVDFWAPAPIGGETPTTTTTTISS